MYKDVGVWVSQLFQRCGCLSFFSFSGYVTWVGFEQDQVTFTRGEDHLTWFDSSPGAQRGFCRQCGSSMFFHSERWAGELHIALGCMNGEIGRQPQANVFFDQHVAWIAIDETLEQVDG